MLLSTIEALKTTLDCWGSCMMWLLKKKKSRWRVSLGALCCTHNISATLLLDSEVQAYRNDVVRLPISQII